METVTTDDRTTIQLRRSTWARLNALRLDPKDSHDAVVSRLLDERESAEKPAERRESA